MLPILHKNFAMIKQKSENEHVEQSTISLKSQYYYRTDEKLIAKNEWYKIVVAGLVKLSKLISWQTQKSKGLLSKPELERNSSLREWQQVYLEQEVAFLSGKYKKARGEQKPGKNIRKNLQISWLNRNILQVSLEINKCAWHPGQSFWSFNIKIISPIWGSLLWFYGIISVGDSWNANIILILFLRHNDWNVFAKNEICNILGLGVNSKRLLEG